MCFSTLTVEERKGSHSGMKLPKSGRGEAAWSGRQEAGSPHSLGAGHRLWYHSLKGGNPRPGSLSFTSTPRRLPPGQRDMMVSNRDSPGGTCHLATAVRPPFPGSLDPLPDSAQPLWNPLEALQVVNRSLFGPDWQVDASRVLAGRKRPG